MLLYERNKKEEGLNYANFEVEVYICGDAICFNGFSETPPKGRIQI